MLKNRLLKSTLILLCFIFHAAILEAQFRPPKRSRELYIEIAEEGLEMLRRARRYREISDWALAVQSYDKILSDAQYTSMLFRDPKTKLITGLRAHVRQILLDLPPEGSHAYDLLRRVDAKLSWDKGKVGDIAALQKILTRFPATSYAGKAACRLAEISLEQGQIDQARSYARIALSTFQNSLGDEERIKAYRVWTYCEALRRKPAGIKHLVKKVEAIDPKVAKSLAKLSNRIFSALPDRVMGKPPSLEEALWTHSYPEYHSARLVPPPQCVPYVFRDTVVFHNNSYAYSLSLESGKLLWKTPIKDDAADFVEPEQRCDFTLTGSRMYIPVDGERIVAIDAITGELMWQVKQAQLRQSAGIDFPIYISDKLSAANGRLYVPAITKGDNVEYRLLAFDSASGRSEWSSLLCSIRFGNTAPRFTAVPAGGHIYGLTGDGVLTCLDSVDGSLKWLKEYASGGSGRRPPVIALSGGRLLVAPPELNTVFAYDALTGEELARGGNKGGPKILGVFRGAFIRLYGNGHLRTGAGGARLIAKLGKNLPLRARPRIVGKFVYLSLQPGLLIVDLSTGKKTFMKDWSGLEIPGHVVPAADRVIALTARGVVAYGPKSALRSVLWIKDETRRGDPKFLASCLGSDNFSERQQATKLLLAMGARVSKQLQKLVSHRDLEISMRSKDLIFEFGRESLKKKWQKVMRPEWIAEVPNLFDNLTHRNPMVRLDTLDKVGEIEDQDVLVLFQDLLNDKNPKISLKAAKILYSKKDRTGIPIFEKFLKTGAEKDGLAILAAVEKRKQRAGRREDLPLARLAASSKHAKLRVVGAGLLVDLGDRLALGDLRALLKDEVSEVRVAAIKGLGDLALDSAGPILAPLVTDKARFVRFEAVRAISNLETALAAKALCTACLDKDVPIARTAAEALLRMADSPAAPRIPNLGMAKALDAKDAEVRALVVQILQRGINPPIKLLVRLALDKSQTIHQPALDKIFDRAGPDDIDEVSKIMKSPNIDVRFAAAQILGELGNRRADPHLLMLLSDPDQQVREKAAEYLQQRSHPQVVLQLLIRRQKALVSYDKAKVIASRTAAALKTLKGVSAKDAGYRIALATDKKFQFQFSRAKNERDVMIALLDNMDAETEAPGLILALRSKDLSLRKLAIKDLENITGVTRDYKAEASLDKRKHATEAWSRWYFMHSTNKDVDDTIKELHSNKAKARIDAAKAIRNLWSPKATEIILEALKAEKLPWVAVEIDKVLCDIHNKTSLLPKDADRRAIDAAVTSWQKQLQRASIKNETKARAAPK
jgi:HEAT repeat protein/outer membrane protein assembly factor BamB